MDCFGTYFTHVQTCNVPRAQSATESILGFRVTLTEGFREGILRGLPGTEGLEGTFRELTYGREDPKGHLKAGLKEGYLKVTLRGA